MNAQCQEIDAARYLMLERLCDGEVNDLQLVIAEMVEIVSADPPSIGGLVIQNAIPIGVAEDSRRWSIVFETYVCYATHNESYAINSKIYKWSGKLFRILSESAFLNYVKDSTWAGEYYLDSLHHYQIVCTNHIVDVVTSKEPRVERVI